MASFDEKLIIVYEQHPCLYDKSDKSYKDTGLKENLWKTIAEELNCDVESCKTRMKCLRERYCREKKTIFAENRSGSKPSFKEPWPLMITLSFLKNHVRSRKTYSNFGGVEQDITFVPSSQEPSPNLYTQEDSNFDSVFNVEMARVNAASPSSQNDNQIQCQPGVSGANSQATPRVRKGNGKRSAAALEEDSIGEHLRMVADAANRFTQTFERRKYMNAHGDAAFAEFITIQLTLLPEDVKDDTILKLTQVLMEAKERCRIEKS